MKIAQNGVRNSVGNLVRDYGSKIVSKFHHLLFVFNFFSIFELFFSISHIYTCQKYEIFCGVSLYILEIYQLTIFL